MLQYSLSMERSNFPEPFYICGINKQVNTELLTSDFSTATSFTNNHAYIEISTITPNDANRNCKITVTGTRVTEDTKQPQPNYSETIMFSAQNNSSYQTLAKFYDVTNIDVRSSESNIQLINYNLYILGYVDFLNSNVRITGYRSEILGDLNSSNADIRLSLHRIKQNGSVTNTIFIEDIEIDGNGGSSNNGKIIDHIRTNPLNDRTYEVTSTAKLWPDDTFFVLKMTDFNTYFTNQENYINGNNNEGLIIKIDSTNLGPGNGPRFINIQVYYEYI